MATKRLRGRSWEYVVRRKGLLERPVSLSFATEEEGDAVVGAIEAGLADGVIHPILRDRLTPPLTLSRLIEEYQEAVAVSESDPPLLAAIARQHGRRAITELDHGWLDGWILVMKRERGLAPVTIRHYVGALGRAMDWAVRRKRLAANPVRELPRRYATYNEADRQALAQRNLPPIEEGVRDRRLAGEEEQAVREILDRETPTGRQRPLRLEHREDLLAVFDLALETAMRLREIYTLTPDQVSLARRTVYLDRTKNGDTRQVPLSTVAVRVLQGCIERHAGEGDDPLFPWWSGARAAKELKRVSALLSRQFARIFDAAECSDFHFHDCRHEATCRYFERTNMDMMVIARITGHRNVNTLRRYLSLRGSDLAERLW